MPLLHMINSSNVQQNHDTLIHCTTRIRQSRLGTVIQEGVITILRITHMVSTDF